MVVVARADAPRAAALQWFRVRVRRRPGPLANTWWRRLAWWCSCGGWSWLVLLRLAGPATVPGASHQEVARSGPAEQVHLAEVELEVIGRLGLEQVRAPWVQHSCALGFACRLCNYSWLYCGPSGEIILSDRQKWRSSACLARRLALGGGVGGRGEHTHR